MLVFGKQTPGRDESVYHEAAATAVALQQRCEEETQPRRCGQAPCWPLLVNPGRKSPGSDLETYRDCTREREEVSKCSLFIYL